LNENAEQGGTGEKEISGVQRDDAATAAAEEKRKG